MPLTDVPELRFAVGAELSTEDGHTLNVAAARSHHGRLLVRFAGIDGRDEAEALRGVLLWAQATAPGEWVDDDEFFDWELTGLRVVVAGVDVGVVQGILHLPGHDLLDVARPDSTDVLVPFVATIVTEVDLDAGTVELDPPSGLLDPEES